MESEEPLPQADPDQLDVWVLCRVPRREVCYLRYTLEAYEGLCVPTTLPGRGGVVRLLTSAGLRAELQETLEALAAEMELEILEWGVGRPDPGAKIPE
jgi:hypothetical protein